MENLVSIVITVILCIIFFTAGLIVGLCMNSSVKRDGVMIVDEKMGIASISWEVPYEDVVSAETIVLDVEHKDA